MQRTRICPPIGSSDREDNPHFNVLIAYEDFETGKHAKKTYDFLAQNLGRDCQLTNQMWKFDVLGIPKLGEIAGHDAAAADIIIVSCHGRGDLPDAVKKWLETWVPETANALALVALFACPAEEAYSASSIRSFLAGIARRARVEFFAQPDQWPGKHEGRQDHANLGRFSELTGRTLNTLAGAVQRDVTYPHWGLNE